MPDMVWEVQQFQQLTGRQIFECLQLRINVFIVEQQCVYPDLDDGDQHPETRHCSGRDASGRLIAYARLLPAGLIYPEVSMGRFVVAPEMRGKGIGHQLVRYALDQVGKCWPDRAIRIAAQEYLQDFYAQYKFARVSDVFLDAGVPHVEMLKLPSSCLS